MLILFILRPNQNGACYIVLSIILSLLVGQISRVQLEEQIGRSLAESAHQIADRLDQGMFERYRDIHSLAILEQIRQPEYSTAKKRNLLEEEQKTYPAYAWMGVTDNEGKVIASTQGLLTGNNVGQRPWYQNSQANTYVGDVHEAVLLAKLLPNDTGEPLRFVDIASPIKDNQNNLIGVLGAHLSWSWANEVEQSLASTLGKTKIEVCILDKNGMTLLGAKESQGKKIDLSSVGFDSSASRDFSIATWPDRKAYATGLAHTHGYREYPGLGWIVLVRQQADLALAPARSLQYEVFFTGTFLGILFAGWNWFRSRRIVEPILQLTKAAKNISRGNQEIHIPKFDRHDELATLAEAFQTMIESLNYQKHQLETVNQELILDMAKRQEAEQKVSEQAALLNIATDAIFVRDLDWQILFWNYGAEKIYGWTSEQALGQNVESLLNQDNSPELVQANQIILTDGEWRGELKKITKGGRVLIIDSHWTLARDHDGNPKFILTVDTDITEKKHLEDKFLRVQRLESLGTLAGGIAHDMNNILTPIVATAQLLKLDLPGISDRDQRKRLIDILVESSKRGADLVKQILSFAKGIEGEKATVQIRHLLTEIKEILQVTLPKSISIDFAVATHNLSPIYADASQFQQVFMNLCVNARDAMPNGGILSITAENFVIDRFNVKMHPKAKIGNYVLISIIDTGQGMLPETIDRIFEPFYTTKDKSTGTGLGLSTVLGIVKSHGGFINVYSEINQGSCFNIYFPADASQEEKSPIKELEIPLGQGELILVVDDEILILEITKNSLEAYNYKVITAHNGKEAIMYYQKYGDQIRLALIDRMMPELSGELAIAQLRAINPQLKIIVTSGLAKEEAMMAEVNGFLSKPYPLIKLLSTIHSVLK